MKTLCLTLFTMWLSGGSPGSTFGHDLWLLPPKEPQKGKSGEILAHSGMIFPKSEQAPDPANFARRSIRLPDHSIVEVPSKGTREKSGLMEAALPEDGIYVVGVQTKPKRITLTAEDFNEYLISDGLPHIYLLRHQEKSLDKPAKEQYQKSPKVIFSVGEGKGDPTKPLGLPLEIVPLKNPLTRKVGETLPVQVLFNEKPLVGANLGWDVPEGTDHPLGTIRTDSQGKALIPLSKGGSLMTIRLTHMTRPQTDDYEWESFWTTLTFITSSQKLEE